MKIHLSSGLALFALAAIVCGPAPAAPNELALVQDGRSRFVIVHAAGAPGSVRTAAQELQRYVERSTSAKLPIVAGDAPGETSLSRLYAPGGKLVETFDTQTAAVARATIVPAQAGGDWEGYWCLSIEKAPKGVLDDVYVALDATLPPWFTLDPAEPLTISALQTLK